MTVLVDKNVEIPLRDGTVLRADVYQPADDDKYPVLLQRTPYNKELWPITALTLDPIRAAEAGYNVVIQDVRARWASEGDVFFPYVNEQADGYDTIDWCSHQAGSTGKVGCYGLSYMGGTSWLAAASGHDALGAISPTTAPNDFWRNHFWRGGALNIGTLVMWALRAIGPAALVRATDNPADLPAPFVQLFDDIDGFDEVVRQLPLNELAAAHPDNQRFLPFYFEFLKHPAPDSWTDSVLFSNRHQQVTVPSLSIAGWHDLLLAADLEHFQGMRANAGSEAARQHSKLVVGPWSHGMFQNVVGDLDFGFRANGMFLDLKEDLTRFQLRWFDRWLKAKKNGIEEEPPVKLFVQGTNRWSDETTWPPQDIEQQDWYLRQHDELQLNPEPTTTTPSCYVYDPNNPCPTRGGNSLLPLHHPAGPVAQNDIVSRPDVLSFVSAPLSAPLEIVGNVSATLYASTSGEDTDWIIKLCEVYSDGRIINICDGVLRASLRDGQSRSLLEPDAVERYTIDLWATAIVIPASHRLAVLVTSSDFPRYDRNPNTGEPAHEASRLEPALQRIFHDAERPSALHLPIRR